MRLSAPPPWGTVLSRLCDTLRRDMSYTTIALVQNKLGRPLTSDETGLLNGVLLAAVDEYINKYTDTQFGSNTEVSTFVSGSDGERGLKELVVPTMHTITDVESVKFNGELDREFDDYMTIPRSMTFAYSILRENEFPHGEYNIRVTGKMGFKDVPEDVKLAATLTAATVLQHKSEVSSESVGDWNVSYSKISELVPPTVTDILDKYKRMSRNI